MSEQVKIHPRVKRALDRIGVPEYAPFTPDPFQLEAVEKLEKGDVMVTAPTGSGKTWIATTAITKMLEQGERVWYATPLKALCPMCCTPNSALCTALNGWASSPGTARKIPRRR